jgi:glycine amidinotransferase
MTGARLSSFDEWSALREVVVGSAQNYTSHHRELSFELFYLPPSEWHHSGPGKAGDADAGTVTIRSPINQRYLEELEEDVEGLVQTLESLSVKVLRPMPLHGLTTHVETPVWEAAVVPPLNLRDNTLIVGDEIIETPPMIRSRYFESQFLKKIFMDYFARGARWTVMPRPFMTDASFDISYARNAPMGDPIEPIENQRPSPYDVGFEMLFDGAQCLRLGRDILANVATFNHELACQWLERHLESRFRIHRMHRLTDSHIDTMLLALRPGTVLIRNSGVADFLPEPLRKWDMIVAPEPNDDAFPQYEDDDLILTSPYIDLNVLSVNEETVLVNAASPDLARTLERHGFTVIPVRHRHRRLFGGGFHCFTLDTVRDGGPEDYFS